MSMVIRYIIDSILLLFRGHHRRPWESFIRLPRRYTPRNDNYKIRVYFNSIGLFIFPFTGIFKEKPKA